MDDLALYPEPYVEGDVVPWVTEVERLRAELAKVIAERDNLRLGLLTAARYHSGGAGRAKVEKVAEELERLAVDTKRFEQTYDYDKWGLSEAYDNSAKMLRKALGGEE